MENVSDIIDNKFTFVTLFGKKHLKPNRSRMVCEPNAHMCEQDCEPALHHLRMVRILFATNQNL